MSSLRQGKKSFSDLINGRVNILIMTLMENQNFISEKQETELEMNQHQQHNLEDMDYKASEARNETNVFQANQLPLTRIFPLRQN